ncbi:MAG: HNH endonuclease [Haliea sp.]|nr:HNH endonuclease [Haliea sp.]
MISYWGRCAVSGYPNSRFLVASHIKPWSKSSNVERLNSFNGLLLLPNLDKVFDLGYITFEESGEIRISEAVEQPSQLGLRQGLKVELQPNIRILWPTIELKNLNSFKTSLVRSPSVRNVSQPLIGIFAAKGPKTQR